MKTSAELMGDAVQRARRHWRKHEPGETLELPRSTEKIAFSIAISRESGAGGRTLAEAVASHLGWPVYERELLEDIAGKTGLRTELLESIDEKQSHWLTEWLESLFGAKTIQKPEFARRLAETALAVGAHGQCVMLGRGAAVLPESTTLRVRLVAPLATRVARLQKKLGLNEREATQRARETDAQRSEFVKTHFHKDVADVHQYDLTLNTERISAAQCVDLIIAAYHQLEGAKR